MYEMGKGVLLINSEMKSEIADRSRREGSADAGK